MTTHGGNRRALAQDAGIDAKDLLDCSANINPLGPPEWLRRVISRNIERLTDYPDPACLRLRQAVAAAWGVDCDSVVAGNGGSQLIHWLPRVWQSQRAVLCPPSYIDYRNACRQAGLELFQVRRNEDFSVDYAALETAVRAGDLVILGHPNNPSGKLLDPDRLLAVVDRQPEAVFVVDEAFIDFVETPPTLINCGRENVVVLRSFTKFYAIPGLRLGFAVGAAARLQRLAAQIPDWSVNSLALAVGTAAIADVEYAAASRAETAQRRQKLQTLLTRLGLHVYPAAANYLLCRFDGKADQLARDLLQRHGIAIRSCADYDGLDRRFFRVAVKDAAANARLTTALAAELKRPKPPAPAKRTPAIMFQGTGSNAGKSILAAALCRVLLQDGIRVAPYKAQNMSNNSFVTRRGEEVARAQVVQAQACRLDPDVRMSPILLKPDSDTGCQVILCGRPIGNMQALEYDSYKADATARARECYDALAAEYDAVVLEGAGSPGEVNLKANDIVNMPMARYAQAPVLLVGDIDRGGVFAGFVGHLEVMNEWERQLLAGFLVNKFRGDASLLGNAFDYTLEHTGKPVLGTIPYIHNLGLPEEDAVSFKQTVRPSDTAGADHIEIAVIDLPHISNFSDLDPFAVEPDVVVRVVRRGDAVGAPDAVILPGTKNTIGDLQALRETGIADALLQLPETCEIVGLCGGFQMLGAAIADPLGLESAQPEIAGLGLLPMTTELAPDKVLCQVQARHNPSGCTVAGYEIHHGRTETGSLDVVIETAAGVGGVGAADGRIWGTYLHGVFDADEFRWWFIDRVRVRKGLAPVGAIRGTYDLEPAFERLADIFRRHVDLDAIYRMMRL